MAAQFTAKSNFLGKLAKQLESAHGRQGLLQLWRKIFQFDKRILQNSRNADLNMILTSTFESLIRRTDPLGDKNKALDLVPWCLALERAAAKVIWKGFPNFLRQYLIAPTD